LALLRKLLARDVAAHRLAADLKLSSNLQDVVSLSMQSFHLGIQCVATSSALLLRHLVFRSPALLTSIDREREGLTRSSSFVSLRAQEALKLRAKAIEQTGESLVKVADQVPSVQHLQRLRCSIRGATRIFRGSVACDDLNAGMLG
jgi:hypothetical protein